MVLALLTAASAAELSAVRLELPLVRSHDTLLAYGQSNAWGTSSLPAVDESLRWSGGAEGEFRLWPGRDFEDFNQLGLLPIARTTLCLTGDSWLEPEFQAQVAELSAQAGARIETDGDRATWFLSSTAGLRLSAFHAHDWPVIGTAGLGMDGDAGVATGTVGDQARWSLALRASAVLRPDLLTGTLQTPDGTLQWTYLPGVARVSLVAGVELP